MYFAKNHVVGSPDWHFSSLAVFVVNCFIYIFKTILFFLQISSHCNRITCEAHDSKIHRYTRFPKSHTIMYSILNRPKISANIEKYVTSFSETYTYAIDFDSLFFSFFLRFSSLLLLLQFEKRFSLSHSLHFLRNHFARDTSVSLYGFVSVYGLKKGAYTLITFIPTYMRVSIWIVFVAAFSLIFVFV